MISAIVLKLEYENGEKLVDKTLEKTKLEPVMVLLTLGVTSLTCCDRMNLLYDWTLIDKVAQKFCGVS